MSKINITAAQPTNREKRETREVELPTSEEFAQLLHDDSMIHSSINSTNYTVYTRGSYSRFAR